MSSVMYFCTFVQRAKSMCVFETKRLWGSSRHWHHVFCHCQAPSSTPTSWTTRTCGRLWSTTASHGWSTTVPSSAQLGKPTWLWRVLWTSPVSNFIQQELITMSQWVSCDAEIHVVFAPLRASQHPGHRCWARLAPFRAKHDRRLRPHVSP